MTHLVAFPQHVRESLRRYLNTDPHADEFLEAIESKRDELLRMTMANVVSDADAARLRYMARGFDEVLTSLRDTRR